MLFRSGGWDPEVVLHQQELSRTRQLEFRSRINVLKQQALMAKAALRNSKRQYGKYAALLPIVAEQRKKTEELASDGTVSMLEHQTYLQKEIEVRQDLLSQRAEVDRNEHTVAESDMELKKGEAPYQGYDCA